MKKFIYKERIESKRILHIGSFEIAEYQNGINGLGYRALGFYKKGINFRTYDDLSYDIKTNLHKIPDNIDLIVGIPRSGMIAALMISFLKNIPVISVEEFINGIRPDETTRPLSTGGGGIIFS